MVGNRLSLFSWGGYDFRLAKASLACYPLKGPGAGSLAEGLGQGLLDRSLGGYDLGGVGDGVHGGG